MCSSTFVRFPLHLTMAHATYYYDTICSYTFFLSTKRFYTSCVAFVHGTNQNSRLQKGCDLIDMTV